MPRVGCYDCSCRDPEYERPVSVKNTAETVVVCKKCRDKWYKEHNICTLVDVYVCINSNSKYSALTVGKNDTCELFTRDFKHSVFVPKTCEYCKHKHGLVGITRRT